MTPESNDREKLLKISEHLHYEYSMLKYLTVDLTSGGVRKAHIYNAMLESFITHLRVLHDFFYFDAARRPDDTLATDFFDSPEEWIDIRPDPSTVLKEAKERANKEVAHLTYARISQIRGEGVWKYRELEAEVTRIFKVFLRNVPDESLCSDLLLLKNIS